MRELRGRWLVALLAIVAALALAACGDDDDDDEGAGTTGAEQAQQLDTIFRNLAQGRFDMVASSTTITEERQRTVDFSDPYFQANQSLIVQDDCDIQSVDDLEGETVGAQLGTTGADYAKEEIEGTEEVRTYDLVDDAFQALQADQISAAVIDNGVALHAAQEQEGLKVVQEIPTDEQYGLAFSKEAGALREAVNQALAEI